MIGLLGSDRHWHGILHQEGACSVADSLGQLAGLAVLALDRVPSDEEARVIAEYVRCGGAVLSGARAAGRVWPELKPSRRRIKYLVADDSAFFRNVGLVDLETDGWQLPDARYGQTDSGRPAIVAGQIARGWLVVLPFEPASVLADAASCPRRFLSDAPRFPSETVSRVSRGEVRRLLANCLRWLINQRGLPYVHLAYVPFGRDSAVGFRVDTDFGTHAELEATTELARAAGMKFSWYVNVEHHREELDFFRDLEQSGHDVGVHCLRHTVRHDYQHNRTEFGQARQRLLDAGLNPVGVAAPYGEWSLSLDRAYSELGFVYSSEFSYAYDDLPSRPVVGDHVSQVLQVPVHPICTGRLLAARAVRSEVVRYFLRCVERQVARQEPCLLYDHPTHVAGEFEVWREVLDHGRQRCGMWTTLAELARFWQRREQVRLGVEVTRDRVSIDMAVPAEDCPVVVEFAGQYSILPPTAGEYALSGLAWLQFPEPCRFDPVLARIRQPSAAFKLKELHRHLLKHLQSRRA